MTLSVRAVLVAVLGFAFLQSSQAEAIPRARLFGEGISFLNGLEGPVATRVGRALSAATTSPYSYSYGYYSYGYGYYPTYSTPAYYAPVISYGTRPLTYNYSPAPSPPSYYPGYIAPVPIPVYGTQLTSSSLSR